MKEIIKCIIYDPQIVSECRASDRALSVPVPSVDSGGGGGNNQYNTSTKYSLLVLKLVT